MKPGLAVARAFVPAGEGASLAVARAFVPAGEGASFAIARAFVPAGEGGQGSERTYNFRMPARFYAPAAEEPGQAVALPDEEAEHLTRVLRLGIGDSVRIFNGRGGEFTARVARAARREVGVVIEARADPGAEPRVRITLIQSVLKPDAMDAVVRDAVMIGIAAIQPVVTTRSETTMAAVLRARRQERWSRIAVASAKQCGRASVPPVRAPVTFAESLAAIGTSLPAPALMFVEPGAAPGAVPLTHVAAGTHAHVSILIGPEGGWTEDELASSTPPARLVTLRLPTIRASAMPLVAVTALLATYGEI